MLNKKLRAIDSFDDLTSMCAHNFTTLCDHVNSNEDHIRDLEADAKELFDLVTKLTKKTKHKAGKGLVFFAIAAGIGYIIKNERDKQRMTMDILKLGKQKYGLSPEDEGDAIEPLGI